MAYTLVKPGQALGGGDERALLLKLFAGEVLTRYEQKSKAASMVKQKTISAGKTYQWPVTGGLTASYHTPGAEFSGQATQQNEKTISIDAILASDIFHHELWDKMSHYDTRSEYSYQAGEILAVTENIAVMKEVIKAARSAATIPGHTFGGTQILNDKFKIAVGGAADANEKAAAIYAALMTAAETMDGKDVPSGNRVCFLRPAEFYCLLTGIQSNGFSVTNKDFMGQPGNLNQPALPPIAGFRIEMDRFVPSTDTSGTDTYHGVDASKTIGICFTPEAVGTVTLLGLQVKSDYLLQYLGTLTIAYFAKGHGVLRPECAVELSLNALSN